MKTRVEYTKHMLDALGTSAVLSLDDALIAWWINPHNPRGLRLTQSGFDVAVTVQLAEPRLFEIGNWQSVNGRILLDMERSITCPYSLRSLKTSVFLVLFGSPESMMLALYGNVRNWIKSLVSLQPSNTNDALDVQLPKT